MSTHGRISVREFENKSREMILYAWHDGHTSEAIQMLLNLPLTLFDKARDHCYYWITQDKHFPGPWYYSVYVKPNGCDSLEHIRHVWRSHLPCEIYVAGVANWISSVYFNRWTVVPDLSWCAYPGKSSDITVDVDDSGYYISAGTTHDAEALQHYQKIIDEELAKINPLFPKDAQIEFVARKARRLTGDKTDFELPQLFVTFQEMTINLVWQELQLLKKVQNGEHKDPVLEAVLEFFVEKGTHTARHGV